MSDFKVPNGFRPHARAECRGGGHKEMLFKDTGRSAPGFRLTPRQRDVYMFIRLYWKQYGYAPSYREIAFGLGLKTRKNIIRICKRLQFFGLIEGVGQYRMMKPAGVSLERLVKDRSILVEDRGWK